MVRMPSLAILTDARNAQGMQALMISKLDTMGLEEAQKLDLSLWRVGDDYHWFTLLQRCLVEWSYLEPLTPENIKELDQATVEYLVGQLVHQESAEEEKKDTELSMIT